jgi:hypothetical protein
MTPNTRAKILPALLLAFPAPLAAFIPHLLGLPHSAGFSVAVAAVTSILALALAGARDQDPTRSMFHGGAPAYWVAALLWLLASSFAAAVPILPGAGWATRWALFTCGTIGALADFGTRVKNR